MAEVKWEVPFKESVTERRIGVWSVRVWRNVPVDWNHPFDSVVDEAVDKIQHADYSNIGQVERELAKIANVTAIQIGLDGNFTVLYLG
jgi:hypothetical protein